MYSIHPERLVVTQDGQTTFVLAHRVSSPGILVVNGSVQTHGASYRVEGMQLVWTGDFPLDTDDVIQFFHQV